MLLSPIWLGEKSSVCTQVIERLYGNSHLLNDAGQWAYYGRVGGCMITGNEDGAKHCAMNILYSLQHLGYVIPPQADSAWLGEAGPGPSYLDPGSGGPENDFTNRNTTFLAWNLHAPRADDQGRRRHPRARQPEEPVGRRVPLRLRQPRLPLSTALIAPTARLSDRDIPRPAAAYGGLTADDAWWLRRVAGARAGLQLVVFWSSTTVSGWCSTWATDSSSAP